MAERGEFNWLAIRRDHANGMSISAIARKYKVRRQTIQERKVAEGWAPQIQNAARRAAEQTARESEEASRPAKIAAVSKVAQIKLDVLDAMSDTIKAYNKSEIRPTDKQTRADVFDKVIAGLDKGVSMLKAIDGLAPTMPLETEKVDEDPGKLYEVAIQPAKSA